MLAVLRKKRKAFLSSTSVDLATWRERVRDTLTAAGLSVLTMDEFPAMGKAAGQGSADMVKRCDLLVGIYARRYGTLCPDGRSVTELEYDTAKNAGIPRICLMLKEDAEWPPEFIEGGPGGAALVRFKERVRSDVIVKEFSGLDDLTGAAKAAADEYLQKEQRRRRARLVLLGLGLILALAVSAFAVLVAGTTARIVPLDEVSPATDSKQVVMAAGETVFATGHENGEVYLWNAGGLTSRPFARAGGGLRSLAFTSHGDTLLGVAEAEPAGSHLVAWTVPQGEIKWRLEYLEEGLNTIAVQRQGPGVAVGSADGGISLLDSEGGRGKKYGVPHEAFGLGEHDFGPVADLTFSPDGGRLAVAYKYGVFALLDLSTEKFSQVKIEGANYANVLCFAGEDHIVASGQPSDITRAMYKLWFHHLPTGRVESADADNLFWGLTPLDLRGYFLSANWNGEVALWDVRSRERLAAVRPGVGAAENRLFNDIGYVPEAALIVGPTDKKIFLWRLEWRTVGDIPVFWQGISPW